uniref:Serine/threonine-protein phosphatase 2A activator n=1 Tax=Piliocolobus tephrosceles TaxID=591936 RepID=A0A8C9I2Q4_9PRIM
MYIYIYIYVYILIYKYMYKYLTFFFFKMYDDKGLSYKIVNDNSVIEFSKSKIYNEIINFIMNLNESIIAVEMKPLECFVACDNSRGTNLGNNNNGGNNGNSNNNDSDKGIKNISEHYYQLSHYLKNSLGNKNRIDYGTGHELNFLLFLFCLNKLKFFNTSDYPHLVLVLYRQYLECVRRLQVIYTMEPAGSRGAWGLDDFQFLVFLFGAAQLSYNKTIKTDDVEKKEMLELLYPKYLYFDALRYISMLKRAPFHEASQMLYNISGVETWEKICSGLVKMYQAEVIQKRQIMQHIIFGNLVDF